MNWTQSIPDPIEQSRTTPFLAALLWTAFYKASTPSLHDLIEWQENDNGDVAGYALNGAGKGPWPFSGRVVATPTEENPYFIVRMEHAVEERLQRDARDARLFRGMEAAVDEARG